MRHRGMAGGSSPLLPAPSLRRGLAASISPWADFNGRNILPEGSEDFVTGWTNNLAGSVVTVTPVTETINGVEVQAYRIQSTGGTSTVKYKLISSKCAPCSIRKMQVWAKVDSGDFRFSINGSPGASSAIGTSEWSLLSVWTAISSGAQEMYFCTSDSSVDLDITVYHPQANLNRLYPYSPPAGMPIFPAGLGDAVGTTSPASAPDDVEDGADAQVGVSGLTTTNLLGTYGSFAVDSNGDGLADGWIAYASPVNFSLADGIQHFEGNSSTDGIHSSISSFTEGHVYILLASVRGSVVSEPAHIRLCTRTSTGVFTGHRTGIETEINATTFTDIGYVFVATSTDGRVAIQQDDVGVTSIDIAKYMTIDLTADCPDMLSSLCVDPTAPTTAEKEAIEEWCLANLPYHDNTASLTSPTIVSTDSEGNETSKTLTDLTLRKVPSIADTLNPDGSVTRNIAEYTLTEDDVIALNTVTYDNNDFATIPRTSFLGAAVWGLPVEGKVVIDGVDEVESTGSSFSGEAADVFATDPNNIYRVFPSGTYATLAEAKTALAGTVVRYQLATPTTDSQIYDNLIPAHDGGTISCAGASALSIEWPLEASGLRDNSGHRNSLLFGEGASAPIVDGKAIVFDGVDDYGKLDISKLPTGQNSFTAMQVVMPLADDTGIPLSWGVSIPHMVPYIHFSLDGELVGAVGGNGSVGIPSAYVPDEAIMVTLRGDASTNIISVIKNSDMGTKATKTLEGQLNIGNIYAFVGQYVNGSARFKGNVYLTCVWDRSFSDAEVAQLYMDTRRKMAKIGVEI